MTRLTAGQRVTVSGRRMLVVRVETIDGIPHIWCARNGHRERTFLAAISPNTAPAARLSHSTNGHSA